MSQHDTAVDSIRKPPRVTVLIPVYNRERYVGTAIESILAQRYTDFELLVIDDGSTDGSLDAVHSYRDKRIRVAHHPRNRGIAATRNEGLALARGEYVALLDSDDYAMPHRLEWQVDYLDRHGTCAAVSGWVIWVDAANRYLGIDKARALKPEELSAERLFRCPLRTPATMARTAILAAYRFREQFETSEDYDLWSRIAAHHRIANIPRVLGACRIHSERRSAKSDTASEHRFRKEVFAEQLRLLGITFTSEDLHGHYLLRRMGGTFRPDAAYVRWAARWLSTLKRANRAAAIYPEPAFRTVLSEFWLSVCWNGLRTGQWTSLLRWPTSSLSDRTAHWLWRHGELRLRLALAAHGALEHPH